MPPSLNEPLCCVTGLSRPPQPPFHWEQGIAPFWGVGSYSLYFHTRLHPCIAQSGYHAVAAAEQRGSAEVILALNPREALLPGAEQPLAEGDEVTRGILGARHIVKPGKLQNRFQRDGIVGGGRDIVNDHGSGRPGDHLLVMLQNIFLGSSVIEGRGGYQEIRVAVLQRLHLPQGGGGVGIDDSQTQEQINSVVQNFCIKDGRIVSILFKNGIEHQFFYKD